jgi:hypothetical protein
MGVDVSTPRPARFTRGKEAQYQLCRGWGGPQRRSGRVSESRRSIAPVGIRFPDRLCRSKPFAGIGLKFRPTDRSSRLRSFVAFVNLSRQISRHYLKLQHFRFFLHYVPRCRPPDRQPTTTTGHNNTCCNLQSYAPEDGQKIARNMLS